MEEAHRRTERDATDESADDVESRCDQWLAQADRLLEDLRKDRANLDRALARLRDEGFHRR